MRIAYVSSSRIPSPAANSVQVMRMCEAFARAGHEVVLFARPGDAGAAADHAAYGVAGGFEIVKCRWPRPRSAGALLYALHVAAIVRRGRPDLLYARNLPSLALLASSGTPMVYEIHTPPSRVRRPLAAWVLRRPTFRRLVVVSEALRREYRRLFPWLAPDRIRVAPCGADPASAPAAGPVALPRRPGCLQVGYVGNLYPGKGLELIVPLAASSPEHDFHVVGGTAEDLRRWQPSATGIANLHLHGFVPPARTAAYCQAMDVLLAPYQGRVRRAGGQSDIGRWMSPLKIFEYMAARRPMVASDLPVLREVLQDGGNAILAPPDDVEAWREALSRLKDPALRRHLSDNAYHMLTTSYTWSARAQAVLAGLGDR